MNIYIFLLILKIYNLLMISVLRKTRGGGALIGLIAAVMCAFSLVCAIFNSRTNELSAAAMGSCEQAVELALTLAGTMALWCGLLRIAQAAGITAFFSKLLTPLTSLLFKDCGKQAVEHITMNLTANLLGIGNAATPAGIAAVKAMAQHGGKHLRRNIAMLTVLNTASIQLIPATIGAMRAAHGAKEPFDITLPIIAVSAVSAFAGCLCVYALSLKGNANESQ